MKKEYKKPIVEIENFLLDENIAGECAGVSKIVLTPGGCNNVIQPGDSSVIDAYFNISKHFNARYACEYDVDEDGNGLPDSAAADEDGYCYHTFAQRVAFKS